MVSISECLETNKLTSLYDRRKELDIQCLRKIEFGMFDIKLGDYIRFSTSHNTRGGAISWTQRTNIWRYSYYNRMRPDIKVFTPPATV